MPEIDNTPSEGIDLQDPEPKGRRAISSRLYYTGMVVLAAVALAIVGGLCVRLLNKDASDKQTRESHMASEAASSNREAVEKRQPPDSGNQANPLPGRQPAPPQPQPNPEQPPTTATHPELMHTPDYPAAQPQAVSAQEQARIDAERQAYQEEIAARKAPTSYQAYMSAANGQASPSEPVNQPTFPALPPVPNTTEPPPANPIANDLLALGQKLGLVGSAHPSNANAAGNYPAQNAHEEKTQSSPARTKPIQQTITSRQPEQTRLPNSRSSKARSFRLSSHRALTRTRPGRSPRKPVSMSTTPSAASSAETDRSTATCSSRTGQN